MCFIFVFILRVVDNPDIEAVVCYFNFNLHFPVVFVEDFMRCFFKKADVFLFSQSAKLIVSKI